MNTHDNNLTVYISNLWKLEGLCKYLIIHTAERLKLTQVKQILIISFLELKSNRRKTNSKIEDQNKISTYLGGIQSILNPFLPNVPILIPLKTLENLLYFILTFFSGESKGIIGRKGLIKKSNIVTRITVLYF